MPLYEVIRNGAGDSNLKFIMGTFTTSSTAVHVDIGFKPKYLGVIAYKSNGTTLSCAYIYNADISDLKYMHTAGDVNGGFRNLNATTAYNLQSIDDDGFTVNAYSSSDWRGNAVYFAVG